MEIQTGIIIAKAAKDALELGNPFSGMVVGFVYENWDMNMFSATARDVDASIAHENHSKRVLAELHALGLNW